MGRQQLYRGLTTEVSGARHDDRIYDMYDAICCLDICRHNSRAINHYRTISYTDRDSVAFHPLNEMLICSICLTTDSAGSTSSPLILVYNKQNGRARDVVLH